MTEPERFLVEFASTDDAALDGETTLLEYSPLTLEEIRAACLRYRVRARVFRWPDEFFEVIPEDERECSARFADVTAGTKKAPEPNPVKG